MGLNIVTLAGGVGGAKLVDGLVRIQPPVKSTIIVNTGDDFNHFGLRICPDLDTVVYTLAGIADPQKGWGRGDESWHFMQAMAELGGADWFRLGDRDLALHVYRTDRLQQGKSLAVITREVLEAYGVTHEVLPMSDDPVETIVLTREGELSFQEYFVARGFEPEVRGFRFEGVASAKPTPGLIAAIEAADFVVFCPSNPFVSIDPILSIKGIRRAIADKMVVGVSPIIGGEAVKGPAALMFDQLGIPPSPAAVAEHYGDLLSGILIDREDREYQAQISDLGIEVFLSDIIMRSVEDRVRVASEALQFAQELQKLEEAQ